MRTKYIALLVALVAVVGAVLRRTQGSSLNPQPEPPGLNPQPEPPGIA